MFAPRDNQRINHPVIVERFLAQTPQFCIDETHVKAGIVCNQMPFGEEFKKFLSDLFK